MSTTQTVITALGVLLAALISGWWARRGTADTANSNLTGRVLESLEKRVSSLEAMRDWQLVVGAMKDQYILALSTHIYMGNPPPPPEAPTYPPRPM